MFDLDVEKLNKYGVLEKAYDKFILSLESSSFQGTFEDSLRSVIDLDTKGFSANKKNLPDRLLKEVKANGLLYKVSFGKLIFKEFNRLFRLIDAKSRKINALKAEIEELKQAQSSQQHKQQQQ